MWKPSVLLIPLSVILILTAFQFGIMNATRIEDTAPHPDPLALYDAILPGRSAATLRQIFTRITCEQLITDSRLEYCEAPISDGLFQEVGVTLSIPDLTVAQLEFRVDWLRLGDLVLLWGQPDVVTTHRSLPVARWQRGTYEISARLEAQKRYSLWSPVTAMWIGRAITDIRGLAPAAAHGRLPGYGLRRAAYPEFG